MFSNAWINLNARYYFPKFEWMSHFRSRDTCLQTAQWTARDQQHTRQYCTWIRYRCEIRLHNITGLLCNHCQAINKAIDSFTLSTVLSPPFHQRQPTRGLSNTNNDSNNLSPPVVFPVPLDFSGRQEIDSAVSDLEH